MPNHFTKTLLAIALLSCHGCMVIPVPAPLPSPISNNEASPSPLTLKVAAPDCLGSLPKLPTPKDESSADMEAEADKLSEEGKGQEALDKYSEAHSIYYGELGYAAGRALGHGDYSAAADVNTSVESPEFLFKVGRAFAKTGKHEIAISCFTESLTEKIKSPNDASAYMNRGDAYFNVGNREKARQDYQKSADLFQQYKFPEYKKRALDKLHNATP